MDLSTTEALIIIRSGRVEKELASPFFESVPAFYAFWLGIAGAPDARCRAG